MAYIEAKNLHKSFGDKVAVEDLSMEIRKGQILGLLGPNGAGKSTTIKMLTGQLRPDKGHISYRGQDYTVLPDEVKRKVGIMPQDIVVWEDLNIKENLKMAGVIQDMGGKALRSRIDELVELLSMQDESSTLAKNLSGGFRRRLNLAVSIIHDPEIIFLDEPSPGIDPQSRRLLMDYIHHLGDDGSKAIVLTDHYLDEAEKLSDYIIIIDDGEIVAKGSMAKLRSKYASGVVVQLDFDTEELDQVKEAMLLKELGKAHPDFTYDSGRIAYTTSNTPEAAKYANSLSEKIGVGIGKIAIKEPTLEDIFLLLTGHEIKHA